MKTQQTTFLAGAVTLAVACTVSSLHAQSYGGYYYYQPTANAQNGPGSNRGYPSPWNDELYLNFDAGIAWQQNITMRDNVGDSETVTFDPGARLDFDLGYNLSKNWATEFEVGLIINPVKSSFILGTDYLNVDFEEVPLLVNVVYTLPLGERLSAYAGGGLGGVFSYYSNDFGDTTPTDSAFAFQGMAGFRYIFNERWSVSLGYKFLGTTRHDVGPGVAFDGMTPTEYKSDGTMTHSVLAALTFRF